MIGKFSIRIEESGETFACSDSQNLLRAMEQLGRRGIPVGCRGGGCGVCKVHVRSGNYEVRKMSRACLSEDEEAAGIVLACKVFPRSDLSVSVAGKMGRCLSRAGALPASAL